jgi:diguanylate cyclase (GGDEF)-like protein
MTDFSPIQVAWSVPESGFSWAEANEALNSLGLVIQPLEMTEPFATAADLMVLHSASFKDLDHLRDACSQLARPGLIVVDTLDEETRVFQWPNLALAMDVCRSEALRGQLAGRLRRIVAAVRHGIGWPWELNANPDLQRQVYGREYLNLRLAREFASARKHCRCLTVAWLVPDGFGRITKTYGDAAGDQVLAAFVKTTLANIRVVDWLARYSKEEFCLVMPDTWLDEGRQVAERVRSALSSVAVALDERHTLRIEADIGLAEMTDHEESFEELMQRATESALMEKISA